MRGRGLCIGSFLLAAQFCLLALLAGAQSGEPALPAEAQAQVNRGLGAVKTQEWALAARYFEDARKQAPWSAEILYDTGLAYANGGQEIEGVAWLKAYLAAAPGAANAASVRAEIEKHQTAAQIQIARIFQAAEAAAEKLNGPSGLPHSQALRGIAQERARAGDIEGALVIAGRPGILYWESARQQELWGLYAAGLAAANDPDGAQYALTRSESAATTDSPRPDHDDLWKDISNQFLKRRDLDKAWKAGKLIRDPKKRGEQLNEVAKLQVEDGDFIPAEDVLPLLSDQIGGYLLESIARKQREAKAFAAAVATAERISASGEYAPITRAQALADIAWDQFKAGDVAGAKSTAREALATGWTGPNVRETEGPFKASMEAGKYWDAVRACAILGDYERAFSLAKQVKMDPYSAEGRGEAFGVIAYVQAMNGDLNAANNTLKRAAGVLYVGEPKKDSGKSASRDEDNEDFGGANRMLAQAFVDKGDLPRAIQTLKASRVKDSPFADSIRSVVDAYAAKGNFKEALGAAQLLADEAKKGQEWAPDEFAYCLGSVAVAQIRAGDAGEAQRTLAAIPADAHLAAVSARLAGADAYLERKDAASAAQTLAAASDLAVKANLGDDVLGRIVLLQDKAGDKLGASATRKHMELKSEWLDLALAFSKDTVLTSWQKALEDAGQTTYPEAIPSRLANVAASLGKALLAVRALESKTGR